MRQRFILTGSGLLLALAFSLSGCQPAEDKGTNPKDQAGEKAGQKDQAKAPGKHDKWWCKEHGVPEEECLTCLHTEDELKKMGDWCEKHEVAKSQCFKCDPKLKEKYAAKYRVKYGKEPPPMEDDDKRDGDTKDADKGGKK